MIDDLPELNIAVIGMSCSFPGANGPEEFWRNISGGVESVVKLTAEELLQTGEDPALLASPGYVMVSACLDDPEMFDAAFFGMSPREAELMDPQHRLFLEHSWRAIEASGYDPLALHMPVGVFAGAGLNTYVNQVRSSVQAQALAREGAQLHEVGSVENELDYLATRVSYKLNLTGPSVNVTTACSTSLVAIHLACQSLRTYECDMALAGGVAATPPLHLGYLYQEGGIASADGHTRAFDAAGTGTVLGSGIGVVTLKRLGDAVRDRDVIHGVILASAINNDGSAKAGFTAPGPEGQSQVIRTAHLLAGVPVETIDYVEAHGTATSIGDPIEVAALTKAFRAGSQRSNACALGSVKANIGHMDAAAGVAGLIKVLLAMRHGVIPPQINYDAPNLDLHLDSSPFFILTQLREWSAAGGRPRRAGVSAFGFGGTNAHLVVEDAPRTAESSMPTAGKGEIPWRILPVSARDDSALGEYLMALSAHLELPDAPQLADAAVTLQQGRTMFPHRAAVVARSCGDAATTLRERATQAFAVAQAHAPLAFLFPGQGSQYPGMCAGLYRTDPVFRAEFDRCAGLLEPLIDHDIRALAFDGAPGRADQRPLDQTALTQPVLFAAEWALAESMHSIGLAPGAILGHSLGEFAAAAVSGVLTLPDALRAVATRGRLMQEMPPGAMLTVPLPAAELEPLLHSGVSVAAANAPRLTVVSGPRDGIERLREKLAAREVSARLLRVSHAAHSFLMQEAAERFADFMATVPIGAPRIPYLSNVTGTWISEAQVRDPAYWGRHLRESVRFHDGLRALAAVVSGPFAETGPGTSLLSLARADTDVAAGRTMVALTRHPRDQEDDSRVMAIAVAKLWESGCDVEWSAKRGQHGRRAVLPTYPFQRRRFWIDAGTDEQLELSRKLMTRLADPAEWFYMPTWRRTAPARNLSSAATRAPSPAVMPRMFLIAGDARTTDQLARRLRQAGTSPVVVRCGSGYERRSDCDFTVRLGEVGDYERALSAALAGSACSVLFLAGLSQGALVTGAVPPGPDYHSIRELLAVTNALGAHPDLQVDLLVAVRGLADVVGAEHLDPRYAPLAGIAKVIPRELRHVACRIVDVDGGADKVAATLAAELLTAEPDSFVAHRGGHRWAQGVEPVRAQPVSPHPRLTEHGVYLITGGLGGIGMSLASSLAAKLRARLVLTRRSGFPAPELWDTWLREHSTSDQVSRRIVALREMQRCGAEVLALRSDVTSHEQVVALLDVARRRFGGIDGIIHAAGLPGGGLLQTRDVASVRQVIEPKADGARFLYAATRAGELDFLMLFSSLNTVDARFGIADYTAANTYLDAFAHWARHQGRPEVMAVDWTGWRDLGMAINAGSTAAGNEEMRDIERLAVMSEAGAASFLSEDEGYEAFTRALTLDLPQVHISTQDLDAVVESGKRLDVATALEALDAAERDAERYQRPELETAYDPPRDEVEAFVCDVLQTLLGVSRVGAEDSFFDLGGNSLLAIDVAGRVRKRFDVALPMRKFLANPTARAMSALVRKVWDG